MIYYRDTGLEIGTAFVAPLCICSSRLGSKKRFWIRFPVLQRIARIGRCRERLDQAWLLMFDTVWSLNKSGSTRRTHHHAGAAGIENRDRLSGYCSLNRFDQTRPDVVWNITSFPCCETVAGTPSGNLIRVIKREENGFASFRVWMKTEVTISFASPLKSCLPKPVRGTFFSNFSYLNWD